MVELKEYSKYLNLIVLLITLYLGYLVVRPFLYALIAAVIVAYLFYPWHKKILKKVKRKNLSAFITTIMVLLIVTIPLVLAISAITRETVLFYTASKEKLESGEFIGGDCSGGYVCSLVNQLKEKAADVNASYYLGEVVRWFSNYVVGNVSALPYKVVTIILNLFITFFAMFFIFRDGEELSIKVKNHIPIKKKYQTKILKRFSDITYAVIHGCIITALVQGAAGALGFFIFGVQAPLLWGAIMVIAALIPLIGAPIIWVPAAISLMLNGYLSGESVLILKGIGLFIYGAIIISSIDNFLKPKLIGTKSMVHPLLVFLGVVGGIKLFGLIGFILGPMILAFCITFLKLYREKIV